MDRSRSVRLGVVALALAGPVAAQQPVVDTARLGTISFPTSGPAAAQSEFIRGVLYLHSFEYGRAERAFRRAEALAPDFAMAFWGEAMTYTHPVWNEQDLGSARSALERLGPTPEARRAKAPTARERGFLEAVETLYGEGGKAHRDTAYAAVMERLEREYPDDLEAKSFYALALLGLNQGVRDTVTYLRAAHYADTVFRANPDHPGAAHYLIHSYDDPLHADMGLEAARAYSRIAPGAAHAQHMTTHIFLALGMWDDVVSQNRLAMNLTTPAPGHYSSWLVYGLIQQGRYDAARELIEMLRKNLSTGGLRGQYSAVVEMRAHFLLHSEDWLSPVGGYRFEPERMTTLGQLTEVFTEGAIAYRHRDREALSAASQELARLVEAIGIDLGPTDPATRTGRVMARELGGMQLFLGASREAAIRVLQEATAIEDALPMEFGPPGIVEPSHEILGSMLLEVSPTEAKGEFLRALTLAPGRSRALIGLAHASVAAGDKATAQRAVDQLSVNWRLADPRVRDLIPPLRKLVERMP